jgi:hypothetical protein
MLQRAPVQTNACYAALPALDLVEQMAWEDSGEVEVISLEQAGLEEQDSMPMFGMSDSERPAGGVVSYVEWFYDGDPD